MINDAFTWEYSAFGGKAAARGSREAEGEGCFGAHAEAR